MFLSCDIVMDLVALYKDGLASEDSTEAIEAHLRMCPSCRSFYREYDAFCQPAVNTRQTIAEHTPPGRYTDLSAKLRRRRLFTLSAAALVIGGCACITLLSALRASAINHFDPPDA